MQSGLLLIIQSGLLIMRCHCCFCNTTRSDAIFKELDDVFQEEEVLFHLPNGESLGWDDITNEVREICIILSCLRADIE